MSIAKAYDCLQCPGICCSVYDRVAVTKADLRRLATHLGLKLKRVLVEYTRGDGTLRRKNDEVLGEVCIFFDTTLRRCGAYSARPQVCREWPKPEHRLAGAENRCCYFDLITFTRREHGGDTSIVPFVQIKRVIREGAGR